MYSYYAYGLSIQSELPIPEISLNDTSCSDVMILLGKSNAPLHKDSTPDLIIQFKDQETQVYHHIVGLFSIREGREIIVFPAKNADERIIRLYLIGIVMALLLYQRNLFVLHGSAVSICGQALAILGASGTGKSSTAAALYSRGHSILSDDISAVRLNNGSSLILPGVPQIKLSQATATGLHIDYESLKVLHELETDRGYSLNRGFITEPTKLRCIYCLHNSETAAIERLDSRTAFFELLQNSLPTRFGIPDNEAHFKECIRLAKEIPIFRIFRPLEITKLPDLARMVETHFTHETELSQ